MFAKKAVKFFLALQDIGITLFKVSLKRAFYDKIILMKRKGEPMKIKQEVIEGTKLFIFSPSNFELNKMMDG